MKPFHSPFQVSEYLWYQPRELRREWGFLAVGRDGTIERWTIQLSKNRETWKLLRVVPKAIGASASASASASR